MNLSAPIRYIPGLIAFSEGYVDILWNELAWTAVAGNRREYYANTEGAPYSYGSGAGRRTYESAPSHELIDILRDAAEASAGVRFESVVLNGYSDARDSLGWHSDDSYEVDPARPIAVISLGEERDIMFRPRPDLTPGQRPEAGERLTLGIGSMLLMPAGMQQTHEHRIPKSGRICNRRVSLTFRGYRA